MIGKIVERIVEAKFNVSIYPREDIIAFRIGKVIDQEVCAIDWALTHLEIASVPEYILLDECERKLQQLRAAIETRPVTPAREGNHAK